MRPSEVNATARTLLAWPVSTAGGVFHSRTVRSEPAVARVWPSGVNATEETAPVWPVRGWPSKVEWDGSVVFHSRTVPSSPPVAKVRPSEVNAAPRTMPVWPARG